MAAFDERQLAESIEAAALLEGQIALLAAPRLRRADLAEMRRANRRLRVAEAAGDLTAARDSDRSFHAAVHARCPNRMLVTLVQIAYARMDTLRNVFEHRPQRIGHAADDHDRLIGLLDRGSRPQPGSSGVPPPRARGSRRDRRIAVAAPEERIRILPPQSRPGGPRDQDRLVPQARRAPHPGAVRGVVARTPRPRCARRTGPAPLRRQPAPEDSLAGKPEGDCDWDGVAEQWFDDEDALNAAYGRPVAADVRADTLAHVSVLERLIVRELEIEPEPSACPLTSPT